MTSASLTRFRSQSRSRKDRVRPDDVCGRRLLERYDELPASRQALQETGNSVLEQTPQTFSQLRQKHRSFPPYARIARAEEFVRAVLESELVLRTRHSGKMQSAQKPSLYRCWCK